MPPSGSGSAKLPIQTSADPTTVIENANGNPVFGTDASGNGVILAANSNSLGFDSSGNPQINSAFGIAKVVGTGSTTPSFSGIAPGQTIEIDIPVAGCQVGDFAIVTYDAPPAPPSPMPLGNLAFVAATFGSASGQTSLFYVNTDPINAASFNQKVNVLVLRFP